MTCSPEGIEDVCSPSSASQQGIIEDSEPAALQAHLAEEAWIVMQQQLERSVDQMKATKSEALFTVCLVKE